ncbi:MAG: acetate uptake transporter family protein [Gaiellaceae bacterium]
MSTIDERRERASTGVAPRDREDGWADGFAPPRVVLQPIAAPSVLGLFGFAGATLIVAANLAGWYGNSTTPEYLAPFAAFFGGLAQFMAGMWAYRARDAVATAMHGMWGSFWLGYGLLFLLVATGQLAPGHTMDMALAFWFIALAAITTSGMLGALVEGNGAVTAVLGTLAAGSALAAIGLGWAGTGTQHAAGWLFVISAGCAWYTATAMMLKAASGRVILPLFRLGADPNVPGRKPTRAIELEWAEPGVKQGQ